MTNNAWLSDKALKLLASSNTNNNLVALLQVTAPFPHMLLRASPAFVYATACSHFSFISATVDVKISLGFFVLFFFYIVYNWNSKNTTLNSFSIKGWE